MPPKLASESRDVDQADAVVRSAGAIFTVNLPSLTLGGDLLVNVRALPATRGDVHFVVVIGQRRRRRYIWMFVCTVAPGGFDRSSGFQRVSPSR
jgi:hypothetical protein